jgi:hypothetical protein
VRQDEIERRARAFHDAYFQRSGSNRFEDVAEQGRAAYGELVAALAHHERDERIDALTMLGRLFASHGHTPEALGAVVAHGTKIREKGIGPERHAALFAMGRSGEASLLDSFVTVLAGGDTARAEVACYVLGYARWQTALPFLMLLAKGGDPRAAPAAVWALGQLRNPDALATLLPLLDAGTWTEWVIGALGDIADPRAAEPLARKLEDRVPGRRYLAAVSLWVIVDAVADRKERRKLVTLEPALKAAAADPYQPTAAFAQLTQLALGLSVDEASLAALFGGLETSLGELSGNESFFLARRLQG